MIPFPNKKYKIIYADPPWNHDSWGNGNRRPELHYNTMSLQDIKKLPIENIADKDCVLFLWVTFPHLKEGLEVMKCWGFDYKTVGFTWVKRNKKNHETFFMGCGSWTRANAEICLIGKKGKINRVNASIRSVVDTPIEQHSKKPDVVRERIVNLMGDIPRIELFARKQSEGWDVWGNEVVS